MLLTAVDCVGLLFFSPLRRSGWQLWDTHHFALRHRVSGYRHVSFTDVWLESWRGIRHGNGWHSGFTSSVSPPLLFVPYYLRLSLIRGTESLMKSGLRYRQGINWCRLLLGDLCGPCSMLVAVGSVSYRGKTWLNSNGCAQRWASDNLEQAWICLLAVLGGHSRRLKVCLLRIFLRIGARCRFHHTDKDMSRPAGLRRGAVFLLTHSSLGECFWYEEHLRLRRSVGVWSLRCWIVCWLLFLGVVGYGNWCLLRLPGASLSSFTNETWKWVLKRSEK